jgi:putative membrane protein
MNQLESHNPNRARDHLANERTFLAWMRTALALLGFGAVLVRLRFLLPPDLQGHSHGAQLGMAFGLVGLLLVPLSTLQFLKTRRDIERDSFEPNIALPVAFSVAVFMLGLAVLGFVFSSPTTLERGVKSTPFK